MSTRTGPLSERQHFIIQKIIEGYEHKEVARMLNLANRTSITNEMRMIVAKLGVRNSAAAIALYSRWQACGLSEDDTEALDRLAPEGAVEAVTEPLPVEPPPPAFTGLFAAPPATGYTEDEEDVS